MPLRLPRSSGLFSRRIACGSKLPFGIVTWNARALNHNSPGTRALKFSHLKLLIRPNVVVCVQEVHGTEFDLSISTQGWDVTIFHSPCPERRVGGVASFVSSSLIRQCAHTKFVCLIPGRVTRLTLHLKDGSTMCIWNIHNYNITNAVFANIAAKIRSDIDEASSRPYAFEVLICGDFNCVAAYEQVATISASGCVVQSPHHADWEASRWRAALHPLTELAQPCQTHFAACGNSISRLDRIYSSLPAWFLADAHIRMNVGIDPQVLFAQGVSDHTWVCASFQSSCSHAVSSQSNRAIPAYLCRLPLFADVCRKLLAVAQLDNLSVPVAWELHCDILKEAARITRDSLLLHSPDCSEARCMVIVSISRAVIRQDCVLANLLLSRSALARSQLQVSNQSVSLIDPVAFGKLSDEIRSTALAKEESHLSRELMEVRGLSGRSDNRGLSAPGLAVDSAACNARRHKVHSRLLACQRKRKLWLLEDRRLVLHAVRVGSSDTLTNDSGLGALSSHWASAFAEYTIDDNRASSMLNSFPVKIDRDVVCLPSSAQIRHIINRTRETAPGEDGIPYEAWKFSPMGAETLFRVMLWLAEGRLMPYRFNAVLTVCLPKGSKDEDQTDIIRDVCETRPIGLKNSSAKIVALALNFAVARAVANAACYAQRGFIAGRQMSQNVLDLDSTSRLASMLWEARPDTHHIDRHIPVVILLDFAAAFPSIAHSWLIRVVKQLGLPIGLENALLSFYAWVPACISAFRITQFMCLIRRGVIQGCPLSGTFFQWTLEPFLACMCRILDHRPAACVRACADDVGATLPQLYLLKLILPIVWSAESIAGLRLNANKCVIVPVVRPELGFVPVIRRWLSSNIPAASDMQIVFAGKYLGLHLGPRAASVVWDDACAKWMRRCLAIAKSPVGPIEAIHEYHRRALSVLLFIAQFLPPPTQLLRGESFRLHKILRLPPHSFTLDSLCELDSIALPSVRRLEDVCLSARIRFAVTSSWKDHCHQLRALAALYLPLVTLVCPALCPDYWDSKPFVHELELAYSLACEKQCLPALASTCPVASNRPRVKLQADVYAKLKQDRGIEGALAGVVCTRINALLCLSLEFVPEDLYERVTQALVQLKSIHSSMKFRVLKTLINGWTTSGRLHSDVCGCILGCPDSKDELAHYLKCDRWLRAALCAKLCVGISVLERLCLVDATFESFVFVAVSHAAYIWMSKDVGAQSKLTLLRRLGQAEDIVAFACKAFEACWRTLETKCASESNHDAISLRPFANSC